MAGTKKTVGINPTFTNDSNGTMRRTLRPKSINGMVVEKMLLSDVDDRTALYTSITKNNATHALAVILFLHIKPKSNSSSFISNKTLGTAQSAHTAVSKHCDPIEELNIIQEVRSIFEDNGLFNDVFTLVKYDDKRIFAMCTDPIVSMEKMILAKNLMDEHFADSSVAHVQISGGCEYGPIFELVNDYFGDAVNVASKLGEDTGSPGELLVSFGGREEKYIKQFRHKADFVSGSVEVSSVQIEYYFMEEKVTVGFMEKLCCIAGGGGSSSGGGAVRRGSCSGATETDDVTMNGGVKEQAINGVDKKGMNINSREIDLNGVDVVAENNRPDAPPGSEWEDIVMLQSDLSGFTRLTKKYGILHFMTLILNCRKIFQSHLVECQGDILKYDGDNCICKFTSAEKAIEYVLKCRVDVNKYNEGKEKDFQIRVKIGMAKGPVIVSYDGDIVGDAWEDCCLLSEEMAKVGEILITEEIKSDLKGLKFNCEFEQRPPCEETEMGTHYNLTLKS